MCVCVWGGGGGGGEIITLNLLHHVLHLRRKLIICTTVTENRNCILSNRCRMCIASSFYAK